jgi:hypothetical protein
MKNIFESSDTFTAYATIDAGYFLLEKLTKKLAVKKTPLEIAVDKATGYDKAVYKSTIAQAIECVEDIIEAKKAIVADFKNDEGVLNELKKLQVNS